MNEIKRVTLFMSIAIISLVAFTAWSTIKPSQNESLRQQMIGEWRNVYVKITIHHANKPAMTMEADSSNWEAKLGIQPIRTHFKEDGTYYSDYLNAKDSVVRHPTGIWIIKGDSITMTQLSPDKGVYTFRLKIENNHALFSGLIDFDGEGIANDEYWGIQKRFK
jgi:hypothetical protein